MRLFRVSFQLGGFRPGARLDGDSRHGILRVKIDGTKQLKVNFCKGFRQNQCIETVLFPKLIIFFWGGKIGPLWVFGLPFRIQIFSPRGLSDYDFIQSRENCITSDFNCYHQVPTAGGTYEGLHTGTTVTGCDEGRVGLFGTLEPFLGNNPKIGGNSPKWMVNIMEKPMNKWMIWVVFPLFLVQHPYFFDQDLVALFIEASIWDQPVNATTTVDPLSRLVFDFQNGVGVDPFRPSTKNRGHIQSWIT